MSLITITENMGSGGLTIAKMVASELNIQLYDDDWFQEEAVKKGIRSDEVRRLDTKVPGLLDRILGINPEIYLDIMEGIVYEISKKGEGVIIGHGGQILLRDFGCALHIGIHAPLETRVQNLVAEQNLSQLAAEKIIHKSDQQKNGFFKYAFQMDLSDPSHYDYMINTQKISSELAKKNIVDLATSDEIKACSLTALEAMERMSQIKKVHAELLKANIDLSYITVDVSEAGNVVVYGLAFTEEHKAKIADIVNGVEGVKDAKVEIVVKSSASMGI